MRRGRILWKENFAVWNLANDTGCSADAEGCIDASQAKWEPFSSVRRIKSAFFPPHFQQKDIKESVYAATVVLCAKREVSKALFIHCRYHLPKICDFSKGDGKVLVVASWRNRRHLRCSWQWFLWEATNTTMPSSKRLWGDGVQIALPKYTGFGFECTTLF